jgi:hypothetical protein
VCKAPRFGNLLKRHSLSMHKSQVVSKCPSCYMAIRFARSPIEGMQHALQALGMHAPLHADTYWHPYVAGLNLYKWIRLRTEKRCRCICMYTAIHKEGIEGAHDLYEHQDGNIFITFGSFHWKLALALAWRDTGACIWIHACKSMHVLFTDKDWKWRYHARKCDKTWKNTSTCPLT